MRKSGRRALERIEPAHEGNVLPSTGVLFDCAGGIGSVSRGAAMAFAAAEVKRRIRLFHGLAGEARVIAKTMHDLKSRRVMLFIAASYERMAKNLENAAERLSLPITLSPRLSP
jgi:hypothetical protein